MRRSLAGALRGSVEAGLERVWRASTPAAVAAGLALAPLEMAFAAAVAARNRRYDTGRAEVRSAGVPVVSVGNLVVGGSGKTPMAAWLAAWFLRRGATPGIVTNGHAPDEALLHRRWNPGARVANDRHRAAAAAAVIAEGARVVILDDGFQHRMLARDLDLVLIAAEHPVRARLLPRGPYREPENALARAGGVVVTRRIASFGTARRRARAIKATHGPRCALVRLELARWSDLAGAPASPPAGRALALSGIARPWEFHGLLRREVPEMEFESMIFGDHHAYSAADLAAVARRARGRLVVTTAKDAVKLRRLCALGVDARVPHLEVVVEEGGRWLERALGALKETALAQSPGRAPSGGRAPAGHPSVNPSPSATHRPDHDDGSATGGPGAHGGRPPAGPRGRATR